MNQKKDLTKREKQVVALIVKAMKRKTIAEALGISINTLDQHISHIHLKTGTSSMSEIVVWQLKSAKKNE